MRTHTWSLISRTLPLLIAMLAALPIATSAQETVLKPYEVELVIFRMTNPTGTPEDWAMEELHTKAIVPVADDAGPSTDAAPIVSPAPGSDSSTQLLESTKWKLTPIEAALKRNRSYQLLTHIAWSQLAYAQKTPRPVGVETVGASGTGITGSVTLTRGARLLHLQLDLTYQAPDGQRYVLREQRAVRSTDKHYFDHPQFGVVALVTPK